MLNVKQSITSAKMMMGMAIKSFQGEFTFLSNFSDSLSYYKQKQIELEGFEF